LWLYNYVESSTKEAKEKEQQKKHDQDCKKRLHQGALVLEDLVSEGRQIELHF